MRLKLYRAPSVAEAMRGIRDELGPEALILATRRVADGVEVTAALETGEPDPPADSDFAAPPGDHIPAVNIPAGHMPAGNVPAGNVPAGNVIEAPVAANARAAALAWHGVPAPLIERLQRGASLAAALANTLRFTELALAADSPPLLVVGAPGVGKTLTIARLATRLVMHGAAPMVITTDGRRAGATEQLAAFTRLLGISLIVAGQPVTLARALARRRDGAPVLIDAPGTDAFDAAQREEMAALAATAGATVALVVPAGHDPAEAADEAQAYSEIGTSLLLATRLDLARRLGGILAAAQAGGLALAEAGIGPGAADGLVPLTPAFLAERLTAPRSILRADPAAALSPVRLPRVRDSLGEARVRA
jgi:flagellar biosynthesis protein FlhF